MSRRREAAAGTPATTALTRAGVPFEAHPYEHDPAAPSYGLEAAAALSVPPEQVFKTLLVDGGPPEAAERLRARLRHLPRLDAILLSHRHADHLGGLRAVVLQGPPVGMFLDAPFPHPSPLYGQLVDALAARRVTVRNATAGRRIDLGGGAVITLLGPPEPAIRGTRSDVNSNG